MSKSREVIETNSDLTLTGLLRTHIHLLAFSILLVVINRAAGLAWPYLSKYLIDDVILRHSPSTLAVLVGAGMAATVIQAVSAYLVLRVVGLYANRLVTGLRQQIHRHVSRLPLAYYDANRSGDLASRIMSDIEAVNGVLSG